MTDITTPAMPARKASTLSLRKVLGFMHLWVGLIFSIPFAAIGLTGSLWMLVRDVPAAIEPSAAPAHTIAEYIAAAAAVAPAGMRPAAFEAPLSDKPAAVRFTAGGGRGGEGAGPPGQGPRITVDPASLTPTVAPPPNNGFARLMHDIHGNLMINGFAGRQFVGWLGVFMTALGLTGIIIWWPKRGQWKRAFKIKLSGGLLRAADAAVELARGTVADGILRTVTIPANPRQPYRVAFSRPGDQMSAPLVTIAVDPWTKQVMDVRDPDAYAVGEKFLTWQRALHSGSGLGMGWWVLVFISGLLPPLFAVTGVTMWWLRRKVRG